jgi:hypothetical protein
VVHAVPENHEKEVRLYAPLVHLIDEYVGDVLEVLVILEPLEKDTGGAEEHPGVAGGPGLEADGVTYGATNGLPALGGHALGHAHGGYTSGLSNNYVSSLSAFRRVLEYVLRNLGSLSTSRFPLYDGNGVVVDGGEELFSEGEDGEGLALGSHGTTGGKGWRGIEIRAVRSGSGTPALTGGSLSSQLASVVGVGVEDRPLVSGRGGILRHHHILIGGGVGV